MLAHRGFYLDVQLFADCLAHAVQCLPAAAGLLVLGQLVLDTLARQVRGKGFASELAGGALGRRRQARIGQTEGPIGRFLAYCDGVKRRIAFGLVEDPIDDLLATGGEAFVLRQTELFLKLAHSRIQFLVTRFEGADVGLRGGRYGTAP